ncbi:response regulator transcription factor [Deinococcus sonorensis]|uniref:Response regulator transcription factor n=2 Tax=Deinococcus sonorensis TaxID=309891 RepID=A0AAU7U5V2_9DEIO
MTVRVLVVDDQPWVRVGLRELLNVQLDVQVAGEADSGEAALTWLVEGRCDVVLMDVRMPGLGGIEAARRVVARGGPPVVLLTTFEETAEMVAGLRAGAHGYLLKDTSVEALTDAIRRVARGERVVQPRVADVLAEALARRDAELGALGALTPREVEVLTLLAQGLPNKRVAVTLGVSAGTVKVHVSNLLAKLGVTDRAEAVRVARRAGLLPGGH